MITVEQLWVCWAQHAGSMKLASLTEHLVAEFSGLGKRNHEVKHKNASSTFAFSKLPQLDGVS